MNKRKRIDRFHALMIILQPRGGDFPWRNRKL